GCSRLEQACARGSRWWWCWPPRWPFWRPRSDCDIDCQPTLSKTRLSPRAANEMRPSERPKMGKRSWRVPFLVALVPALLLLACSRDLYAAGTLEVPRDVYAVAELHPDGPEPDCPTRQELATRVNELLGRKAITDHEADVRVYLRVERTSDGANAHF